MMWKSPRGRRPFLHRRQSGTADLCELDAARRVWEHGEHPVTERLCEVMLREELASGPLPTMRIAQIAALSGFASEIDHLSEHQAGLVSVHAVDALVAAFTGWLHPSGLEAPPPGFNLASGWIWALQKTVASTETKTGPVTP